MIAGKFAISFVIARLDRGNLVQALRAASVLTPAGEFSFVLLPLAVAVGVLDGTQGKFFVALAACSMLVGPIVFTLVDRWIMRLGKHDAHISDEISDDLRQAKGTAIVIGGGRFGQIVNQMLLAARTDVTVIDNDIEMSEAASRFGFKIYFGDGSRLDVLRAAGAEKARIIAVCINDKDAAVRIAEFARHNFPLAKVYVRAYDRRHALELMDHEPELIMRETLESAMAFGQSALIGLGLDPDAATSVEDDIRHRDQERLVLQKAGTLMSGIGLAYKTGVQPEPLTAPISKSQALSTETQEAIDDASRATQ